jgi:hypothetical protein
MIRMNLGLSFTEVELLVASLYAKHTSESRQLAAQIKRVRDEHKAMFGLPVRAVQKRT